VAAEGPTPPRPRPHRHVARRSRIAAARVGTPLQLPAALCVNVSGLNRSADREDRSRAPSHRSSKCEASGSEEIGGAVALPLHCRYRYFRYRLRWRTIRTPGSPTGSRRAGMSVRRPGSTVAVPMTASVSILPGWKKHPAGWYCMPITTRSCLMPRRRRARMGTTGAAMIPTGNGAASSPRWERSKPASPSVALLGWALFSHRDGGGECARGGQNPPPAAPVGLAMASKSGGPAPWLQMSAAAVDTGLARRRHKSRTAARRSRPAVARWSVSRGA